MKFTWRVNYLEQKYLHVARNAHVLSLSLCTIADEQFWQRPISENSTPKKVLFAEISNTVHYRLANSVNAAFLYHITRDVEFLSVNLHEFIRPIRKNNF